jgi:formylglycine-generating enzyme required for sulfatase activity
MNRVDVAIHADAILAACAAVHRELHAIASRDPDDLADLACIARLESFVEAMGAAAAALPVAERAALEAQMTDAIETAESALGLCFTPRTKAAREYLNATLRDLRERLAVEARGQDDSRAIVGVPVYSQPGDASPKRERDTAQRLRDKLRALVEEAPERPLTTNGHCGSGGVIAADLRDVSQETRDDITRTSIALENTFRALHDVPVPTDKIPRAALPARNRPAHATQTAVHALKTQMDRENSLEGFTGYQRTLQQRQARLGLVGGIDMVLVPGGDVALGAAPPVRTLTGLPLSSGPCERLDAKPKWWLEAGFGDPGVDGVPQAVFGCTRPRCATVPSMLVSRTPITVAQYAKLRADRRLALAPLDGFYMAHVHRRLLVDRRDEGVSLLPLEASSKTDTASQAAEGAAGDCDRPLCIPFYDAERVAEALGGYLVPVDCHEVAMGGVEGQPFPCPADVADAIALRRVEWSTPVEQGRRTIGGSSFVTPRETLDTLREVTTPCGLADVFSELGEWNSTALAQPATAPAVTDHAVRSFVDYGTQYAADRQRDVGFVGPAVGSYGSPWGHPTAAFRVCLPATLAAAKVMEEGHARHWQLGGRNLTFRGALRALGSGRDAWLGGPVGPLRVDRWGRDPLYDDLVAELHSGGVDVCFDSAHPHSVKGFAFYVPRPAGWTTLPSIERRAYHHPIAIPGLPVLVLADSSSAEAFIAAARCLPGKDSATCSTHLVSDGSSRLEVQTEVAIEEGTEALRVPMVLTLKAAVCWRGAHVERLTLDAVALKPRGM